MSLACIGFGQVRHTRLRPRRHAFAYGSCFLMLPMRRLDDPTAMGGLAVNRAGVISFHDRDHGDGRGPETGGALAWVESLLRQQGIEDADGEVWLQTYPRMLGYTFKPVSFWFCHRVDGSLRAIVAEVNNTFGERHCYLLDSPHFGVELAADKCFHVSPFCTREGRYRFRFMRTERDGAQHTVARVDYDDAEGPLLNTSLSGRLQPVSAATLRRVFWNYPAMTLMIMARIHWQALRLLAKRVAFHRKPAPPEAFVSRQMKGDA